VGSLRGAGAATIDRDHAKPAVLSPRYISSFLLRPGFSLLPVLIALILVGRLVSPSFWAAANIWSVLQASSELAMLTMGLTFVLLTGRFDLSLESTFGLAPMVGVWLALSAAAGGAGVFSSSAIGDVLGLITIFAVALAVAAVNSALVVYMRFNAFIVTLAMLILLRGINEGLTDSATLTDLPEAFTWLGATYVGPVPMSLIVALVVLAIGSALLHWTPYGRAVFAIGGNEQAARVAGIRVQRILVITFAVAGLLAALGGLLQTGRIASVTPTMGQNDIFSAFAAAVLGGVSLRGGRGTLGGACLGVLLLGIIQNILTLSLVSVFWVQATTGGMIVVALLFGRLIGTNPRE
jgi:simple sugar transport system permease protein